MKYSLEDVVNYRFLFPSSCPRDAISSLREAVKDGLPKGGRLRIDLRCVKDIIMASKGDAIFIIPFRWLIAVNVRFDTIADAFRNLLAFGSPSAGFFEFEVIKDVPERKFALVRLVSARVVSEFTRDEEEKAVLERGKEIKVDGVVFTLTKYLDKLVRLKGEAVLEYDGSSWRLEQAVRDKRQLTGGEVVEEVEYEVVDGNTKLAGLIRRHEELHSRLVGTFSPSSMTTIFVSDEAIVKVRSSRFGVRVKVREIRLPPEDELLECSTYYTIIVPRIIVLRDKWGVAEFEVFSRGRKRRLVLNTSSIDRLLPLMFRIVRRRYTISTYMRRILPSGLPNMRLAYTDDLVDKLAERAGEFSKFVGRALEIARARRPRKLLEPDELMVFFEDFYAKIPKRKIKVLESWLRVMELVRNLAPKVALYVVFYGRGRRRPLFPGFKVDKDGRLSVISRRVVPVSGVVLRGGAFEKAYREEFNLDPLIRYQLARKEKKLDILMESVEEIRAKLSEKEVEATTSQFKEVEQAVRALATSEDYPSNIVLCYFKFLSDFIEKKLSVFERRKYQKVAQLLLGIVKTGDRDDLERLADEILPTLRIAIKYEIKRRGYSIHKGVMFLGNPDDVATRVFDTLKRIRGRLKAVIQEIVEKEEIAPKEVVAQSKRILALLESL